MVLGLSLQACDKGCLKCNAKNECVFCDSTSSYYLSGTSCVASTQTNCALLAQNGDCAVCTGNYFVDGATKKCVAVESTKVVTNCLNYSSAQACLRCAKNFLVKDGKCAAVTKLIDNCEYYVVDGICAGCSAGYIFNANRDGCVASPNASNCAAYSFLECKSCASGYIANPNLYFTDYGLNSSNILNQIISSAANNDWTNLRRCQKVADANCLVASTFNVCVTCNAGYFLTADKSCRAYPNPIIEGCLAYSNLISCRLCQVGYFLESTTKCTLITSDRLITDCQTYNNAASSVVCTLCATNKYLSGNTCTNARVTSLNLAQCKATTVDADTCEVCNDGFTLTTDKKLCLASIANCSIYTNSNSASTTLSCSTCKSTFYLITTNGVTTCNAGGIEGCLTYFSATVCNLCNPNGYYLSGSICIKHVNIENCAAYHASNFNECATCAIGFYPFKYQVNCASITPILNCITYTDESNCFACAVGYFLRSNGCVALSTLPNCKTASGAGVCLECSTGYALTDEAIPSCLPVHNYISDNCATLGDNSEFMGFTAPDSSTCLVCKENNEPLDLSSLYGCIKNDLLYTKGIVNTAFVNDCKRYANDDGDIHCQQCVSPKKLRLTDPSTFTCVDSCNAATETHYDDTLFGIDVAVTGFVDACFVYAGAFGRTDCVEAITINDGGYSTMCVGYTSTFRQKINDFFLTNEPQIARDIVGSTVVQPSGAFLYNGFFTTKIAATTIDGSAFVTDCELYAPMDAINYCYRCKWNFASLATDHAAVGLAPAYKTAVCEAVTDCDPSVVYGGFTSTLNQLLSCHQCTGSKKLLLTVEGAEDTDLAITGLRAGTRSLSCVANDSALLPAGSNSATNYCQVFVNIGLAASDTADLTKGCVACKPGYYPTQATAVFDTCTAVPNCDTSRNNVFASGCGACSQTSNSGVVNRAFEDLNLQNCITVVTANCLIASSLPAVGTKNCALCQAGFVLNSDGTCTKYTFPKCNDVSVSTFIPTADSTQIAYYKIIKKLTGQTIITGCDTCVSGYTSVQLPSTERQCVGSDYVTVNTYATSTFFVRDCAKYKNLKDAAGDTRYTCSVCKNNKVVTANGRICADVIQNCVTAQDSPNQSKCSVCAETFVNVNGNCILKNIANCVTWVDTISSNEQQCDTCADGYYLTTAKTCLLGSVSFCKRYILNSPNSCITCLSGYNKVDTNNGKTYCIKINTNSNCQNLEEATGLQLGLYRCDLCSVSNTAAFYKKVYSTLANQNTLPQNICLSLNNVEKCVEYGASASSVAANTFLCTKCDTGFYLKTETNTCVARVNQPAGCLIYYVAEDKCLTCSDSTFKNALETDCVSFPNGILGCATYSNDTVCTGCNAPRFLGNNTCTVSTIISKCSAYSANYTCTACEAGYFLTNSTFCEIAKASGCYTFSSISACAKCDPANLNKGLRTDSNGITNCVDKNVPNCDISTNEFPFKCTQCKRGFFLGTDGNCAASVVINRCALYDSSNTCTLCDSGSVLTSDRKACNDTYFNTYNDAFCVDSQLLSTAACSKCSPGYIFSNGTCSSCGNNTFASGCFSCDPANQTVCFACRPGYFQSANGACQPNNVIQPNNTNSSVGIAKMFALLALIFAMMI